MTNKQSWESEIPIIYGQIMRSQIGSERPVGIQEAQDLLKDFIRQLLTSKSEQMERERLTNKDQAWNMLCAKSINDVGLDEGSMELFNAGISACQEILKK